MEARHPTQVLKLRPTFRLSYSYAILVFLVSCTLENAEPSFTENPSVGPEPAATISLVPRTPADATAVATATPGPTSPPRFTATPTPTAIGGILNRFAVARYDGLYWNTGEPMFRTEDVAERAGKEYGFVKLSVSPAIDSVLIVACNYPPVPGPAPCDTYIATVDLTQMKLLPSLGSDGYLRGEWSPDGEHLLLLIGPQALAQVHRFEVTDLSGVASMTLRKTAYDRTPIWSCDSSALYWGQKDVLEIIPVDGSTRRSIEIEMDESWGFLRALAFAPDCTQVAAVVRNTIILAEADFSEPRFFDLETDPGSAIIRWSPDARYIAIGKFSSTRYLAGIDVYDVETMQKLASPVGSLTHLCGFTPDSRNLVVMIDENFRDLDPSNDVYAIELFDYSNAINLTESGLVDAVGGCPVWGHFPQE